MFFIVLLQNATTLLSLRLNQRIKVLNALNARKNTALTAREMHTGTGHATNIKRFKIPNMLKKPFIIWRRAPESGNAPNAVLGLRKHKDATT